MCVRCVRGGDTSVEGLVCTGHTLSPTRPPTVAAPVRSNRVSPGTQELLDSLDEEEDDESELGQQDGRAAREDPELLKSVLGSLTSKSALDSVRALSQVTRPPCPRGSNRCQGSNRCRRMCVSCFSQVTGMQTGVELGPEPDSGQTEDDWPPARACIEGVDGEGSGGYTGDVVDGKCVFLPRALPCPPGLDRIIAACARALALLGRSCVGATTSGAPRGHKRMTL
jgi:hypothetical protein